MSIMMCCCCTSTQLQAAFWTCKINSRHLMHKCPWVSCRFPCRNLSKLGKWHSCISVQQTHCNGQRCDHEANLELCRDDPKLPSSLKRFARTLLSGGKSWQIQKATFWHVNLAKGASRSWRVYFARLLVCNNSNLFFSAVTTFVCERIGSNGQTWRWFNCSVNASSLSLKMAADANCFLSIHVCNVHIHGLDMS